MGYRKAYTGSRTCLWWITACTKSPGWPLQAGSNREVYGTHWCPALLLGALLAGSLICSGDVLCLNNLFWQPQPRQGFCIASTTYPGDTHVITPAVWASARYGPVLGRHPAGLFHGQSWCLSSSMSRQESLSCCHRRVMPTPGSSETIVTAMLVLNSSDPTSSVSSSGPSSSLSMAWCPQPAWRASRKHPSPGWTSTAPSQRFGQVGGPVP